MASPAADSLTQVSIPREGLIDTAVRFLTNPNVIDRPFAQKQSFLRSKGMTEEEIRISCDRANVFTSVPVNQPNPVVSVYGLQNQAAPQPLSIWFRIRDILHTLALLGGLGYAIYWVYKSYVEPFLFGRPKPKKSTEESLSSIEEAVEKVSQSTNELKAEIRSELSRLSQERDTGAARNLADLKSDISTVKGLLLSRQQFPSAPSSTSLRSCPPSRPSIPAWQMSEDQKNSSKSEEQVTAVEKQSSGEGIVEIIKESSGSESVINGNVSRDDVDHYKSDGTDFRNQNDSPGVPVD